MKILTKIDPLLRFIKLDEVFTEPRVVRVKNIDEEGLEHFEADMREAHQTGQPIIPVMIDSYGGETYACLGFISCIEHSSLPVATIITSKAMSAGAIIFGFGTPGYRFMDPNAILMIHELGTYTEGKISDIKGDTRHLAKLDETIYKRLAKHLGHPEGYFLKFINEQLHHRDWFLTAKEAKKHKIANHLSVPHLEVEISVKINFVSKT